MILASGSVHWRHPDALDVNATIAQFGQCGDECLGASEKPE